MYSIPAIQKKSSPLSYCSTNRIVNKIRKTKLSKMHKTLVNLKLFFQIISRIIFVVPTKAGIQAMIITIIVAYIRSPFQK